MKYINKRLMQRKTVIRKKKYEEKKISKTNTYQIKKYLLEVTKS